MPDTTPRLALPFPEGSDSASVHDDMAALAGALDELVPYGQGLASARPAAGSVVEGFFYFANDTGMLSWADGADWNDINVADAVDAAAGVGSLRTIGTGALQAASGADARLADARTPTDNSVTAPKVHTGLKPSTGAGGATEALRALGTDAGKAAAGSHASQHALGGADPLALVARVTTLPASPVDGQITYFATGGADDETWCLRWRASTAKWMFVGGPALVARTDANVVLGSVTPQSIATAVQIAAPRPGLYVVEHGGLYSGDGITPNAGFQQIAVNGSVAGLEFAYTTYAQWNNNDYGGFPGAAAGRVTVTVAGHNITVFNWNLAGNNVNYRRRWLTVLPVHLT